MRTIHRFVDFVGGATFHINWYFLCAVIVVGVIVASVATRRR